MYLLKTNVLFFSVVWEVIELWGGRGGCLVERFFFFALLLFWQQDVAGMLSGRFWEVDPMYSMKES